MAKSAVGAHAGAGEDNDLFIISVHCAPREVGFDGRSAAWTGRCHGKYRDSGPDFQNAAPHAMFRRKTRLFRRELPIFALRPTNLRLMKEAFDIFLIVMTVTAAAVFAALRFSRRATAICSIRATAFPCPTSGAGC